MIKGNGRIRAYLIGLASGMVIMGYIMAWGVPTEKKEPIHVIATENFYSPGP